MKNRAYEDVTLCHLFDGGSDTAHKLRIQIKKIKTNTKTIMLFRKVLFVLSLGLALTLTNARSLRGNGSGKGKGKGRQRSFDLGPGVRVPGVNFYQDYYDRLGQELEERYRNVNYLGRDVPFPSVNVGREYYGYDYGPQYYGYGQEVAERLTNLGQQIRQQYGNLYG